MYIGCSGCIMYRRGRNGNGYAKEPSYPDYSDCAVFVDYTGLCQPCQLGRL